MSERLKLVEEGPRTEYSQTVRASVDQQKQFVFQAKMDTATNAQTSVVVI